jgi:hypothetical protein
MHIHALSVFPIAVHAPEALEKIVYWSHFCEDSIEADIQRNLHDLGCNQHPQGKVAFPAQRADNVLLFGDAVTPREPTV